MVALGIMSIISIGLLEMSKRTHKTMRTASVNSSIHQKGYEIQSILSNSESCFKTFVPNKTPTIALPSESAEISKILDAGGKTLIEVGKPIGNMNEATVTRIWLEAPDFPTPHPSYGASGSVNLHVFFNKNGSVYGGKVVRKSIKIQLNTDTSGNVKKCYSDIAQAVENARRNFCEEDLGGAWKDDLVPKCRDPNTNGPLITF